MPKFSHPKLAVIHPSPTKKVMEPKHIPPKTLNFDGTTVSLETRSTVRKRDTMDKHLIQPEIPEEVLMKIKAQ